MVNQILKSAVDAIGNMPLVALDRLARDHDGRVLAKLEFANSGLAKKGRAARMIIDEAERAGELQSGEIVVWS